MSKKFTIEDFIKRAREVHGDKYDYSSVQYVNAHTPINIICSKHSFFTQKPYLHLQGQGCKKCGVELRANKKRHTKEEFIRKAHNVHGDKYDYSLVDYKHSEKKVKIICPEHGVFEQAPYSHLNTNGCRKCSGKYMDTNYFILKANEQHKHTYDYSLVNYVSAFKEVKIICQKHGVFEQKPHEHLKGCGCRYCAGSEIYNLISLDELKIIVRGNNIKSQKEYWKWWGENKDWCQENGIPSHPNRAYK